MRRLPVIIALALAPACGRHNGIEIYEIAARDTAGWAHDVKPEGGRLYVSDRQGGFLIFPYSSEWNKPQVYTPVADVISLAPHGGEPVLASRFEGLVLVSAKGQIVARYSNGDIANAVATRGDIAFAAYGLHGLVVARLSASNIIVLAELPSPGWSHDVKLSRGQAFLADWNYGFRAVDIKDPARPSEIAVLPGPATTIAVAIRDSAGSRVAAIAEGHAGVALASLDDSGRPHLLGRNGLGLNPSDPVHPEDGGWAHGVAWCGSYVLVANWKRGLAVLDAHNTGDPRVVREIPTNGTALGVSSEQQPDGAWLVFLADGEAGLKVFHFRE